MFSRAVTVVVLVVLKGCDARSVEEDDGSVGPPYHALPPLLPKGASLPPLQENETLGLAQPKEARAFWCSIIPTQIQIPPGGSYNFSSPSSPTKDLRGGLAQCAWDFETVCGTTLSLECPGFYLHGNDTFYLTSYEDTQTLNFWYKEKQFPTKAMQLNAKRASVKFVFDLRGMLGHFFCTISTSTVIPTTTTTKAPPLTSNTCRCGIVNRSTRIVGGTNADVNEYPWQVGIMNSTDRFVFCGGSLISDRHVVTAAHCVVGLLPFQLRLLVGGHTMNSPSVTETIVKPIRIKHHESYRIGFDFNFDISIIEIEPLDFSDPGIVARPICLPDSTESYAGDTATATGWGSLLEPEGVLPNFLQEVDILIITNTDCRAVYGSSINHAMLCAGTVTGGKGTCYGDSGGPLMVSGGANYELVGLTSFARGCAWFGVPTVFTRVTAVMPWIKYNIAGSTICGR